MCILTINVATVIPKAKILENAIPNTNIKESKKLNRKKSKFTPDKEAELYTREIYSKI